MILLLKQTDNNTQQQHQLFMSASWLSMNHVGEPLICLEFTLKLYINRRHHLLMSED